jgi:hypothetical protein
LVRSLGGLQSGLEAVEERKILQFRELIPVVQP